MGHASEFLGDLMALARGLGFDPGTGAVLDSGTPWQSGEKAYFYGTNKDRQKTLLVEARLFLNRNVHLRFD